MLGWTSRASIQDSSLGWPSESSPGTWFDRMDSQARSIKSPASSMTWRTSQPCLASSRTMLLARIRTVRSCPVPSGHALAQMRDDIPALLVLCSLVGYRDRYAAIDVSTCYLHASCRASGASPHAGRWRSTAMVATPAAAGGPELGRSGVSTAAIAHRSPQHLATGREGRTRSIDAARLLAPQRFARKLRRHRRSRKGCIPRDLGCSHCVLH